MAIPQIPPMLVQAVRRGDAVLFVGAGLSQAAGMPGWKGLFPRILAWCEHNGFTVPERGALDDLISRGNLLLAAETLRDSLGLELFRRILIDIFDNPETHPTATHMLLPKIPFAAVFTSNYDKLLETAYARFAPVPHVITHSNSAELFAALRDRRFYILKVHGTIDQIETIVLGNKSYRDLMHGNPPYVEHLKTVLRTKTILFVGFSLSDPDLRLLLDQELVLTKGYPNVHFALFNEQELNPLVRKELEQDYGIRIIPYEPSSEYHPEVEEFFKELARQVEERPDAGSRQALQPEVAQGLASTAQMPEAAPEVTEPSPGQKQMAELVSALTEAVKPRGVERKEEGSAELDDFQLLRLQLYAVARLRWHVPSSMLGAHDANRLYLHRERLKPDGAEYFSLLRMIANDALGYLPGWYWFRDFKPEGLEKLILHLGFTDNHAGVRQGAFNLLADAAIPIPEAIDDGYDFTAVVTSDGSVEVRKAALSYLGRIAGAEYLASIGSALVDEDAGVRRVANENKYLVLARANPERAVAELLDDANVDARNIIDSLDPQAVSTPTLQKAFQHQDKEIRLFAARELLRRHLLSVEAATELTKDPSEEFKLIGYRALFEQGVDVGVEDSNLLLMRHNYDRQFGRNSLVYKKERAGGEEIILAAFKKYSADALSTMADWKEWTGPEAYWALASLHFNEVADQIREDLSNDFQQSATEYYEQQLEEWKKMADKPSFSYSDAGLFSGLFGSTRRRSSEPPPTPESRAQGDVERRRNEYVTAALAGLAAHGQATDVEFGRRFLYHPDYDVRLEALKIVSRFGGESDVSDFFKIAKSTEGVLQELAAVAVLDFASDPIGMARDLIETGDEILISIAVCDLMKSDNKEAAAAVLEPLLYSENEKIRTRVMVFFTHRLTSGELEQLLTNYTKRPLYYYDVVCFFDRALYAPPRLKSYFLREVEKYLFSFCQPLGLDEPTEESAQ